MFESVGYTFQQCLCFIAAGFCFGLLYEPLRFFRRLIRHGTAAVAAEDILFFSAVACVSFVVSLEVGIGYFRVYYAVCEIIGGAVYFLSLGRIFAFANKFVAGFIKRLFSAFFKAVGRVCKKCIVFFTHKFKPLFVKCNKIVLPVLNITKKPLQKGYGMLYNDKVTDKSREGVIRNVIKAEIRKKA